MSSLLANPVRLLSREATATVTRPANTTPYSVQDVVSNSTTTPTILTFANCFLEPGGHADIVKARVFTNSATAMLGAVIRLHLYHTAPDAVADNAQFPLLWANRARRVGFIDFPALATAGTGSDAASALWGTETLPLRVNAAAGSKSLFAIPTLTTVGAAPASGQIIEFYLDFALQ